MEFALLTPLLLVLMMATIGFGYAFFLKLRIVNATSAAAIYAFNNASALNAGTLATFLTNVRSVAIEVAGLTPEPTVSVLFNNAPDASLLSNYYCVSGQPATWTSTGTVVRACGGNVVSGKFVTITVLASTASLFKLGSVLPATFVTPDLAVVRLP